MSRFRIDQILSRHGYCSRSEARGWVRAGRVTVDGTPSKDATARVPLAQVLIDGEPVERPEGILCLLHKPPGVVCSRDEREGPNIFGLIPERWSQRNPPVTSVGRLDKDTTGVLLITDEGTLVQRWTSPRHKVPKLYDVVLNRDPDPSLIDLFASGQVWLPDEADPCLPARLEITGPCRVQVELVEGRFHQVKRMFATEGLEVISLHRSRFGDFELKDLPPGEWRLLPMPPV